MTDAMVKLILVDIEPEPVKTVKLAGKDVPLNTKIVFEPKVTDAIDSGGINEILHLVNDWIQSQNLALIEANSAKPDGERLPTFRIGMHNYIDESDIHEWVWSVKQNKNKSQVGKLPGRISKVLFDNRKLKAPPELLAKIGIVANKHKTPAQDKYVFRVTDDLYWQRGKFGDPGSCWFGDRSASRSLLRGMRGLAVQLFNAADPDEGMARCWLIPNLPSTDTFVVFNGYGNHPHTHRPLNDIAAILSAYLDTEFVSSRPHNDNGETNDMFYINGDAYLLGQHDKISAHPRIELNVLRQFRCSVCDELLEADEAYHDDKYIVYCGEHNGRNFDLLDEDFGELCNMCNERIPSGEAQYDDDDNSICERCYERNFCRCDNCTETCRNDDTVEIYHQARFGGYYSDTWCNSCAEDDSCICESCDKRWKLDEMTETENGDFYCPRCAEKYVFACSVCGDSFHEDDLTVPEGADDTMCSGCADDFRAEQEADKDANESGDE